MKILVLASGLVAAVGLIVEHEHHVETPVGMFPLDVIPGYSVVDVDLPAHYQLGPLGAKWEDGKVVDLETQVEVGAPPLAESIPMLNLKLTLGADGKLTAAEGIFADMQGEEGALARAYWTSALNARRDNFLVEQLWPQLYDDAGSFHDAWRRATAMNP